MIPSYALFKIDLILVSQSGAVDAAAVVLLRLLQSVHNNIDWRKRPKYGPILLFYANVKQHAPLVSHVLSSK